MTGSHYAATPLLRRLAAAHGWRHELARDAHGEPVAVVAMRRTVTAAYRQWRRVATK